MQHIPMLNNYQILSLAIDITCCNKIVHCSKLEVLKVELPNLWLVFTIYYNYSNL
jgi:hypothetical protein